MINSLEQYSFCAFANFKFMNQRFIFLLFFTLSIGAFQCKAQTTFKVYFTYEKCAKKSAFSFWFHDGQKRVPAHVTKLKDEYVVEIKLKTKYTYLQIDERDDNDFRSYSRFLINQSPAKIHYLQCDTNNSSSNWKDIKLENTEFLDIYGPSLYRFCINELEADGKIRSQLINANSKAEQTKLMKDLHVAEQKLFDKRLDFLSTHSNSYTSLFLLRDWIEEQEGVETNKCQNVLEAFPTDIQNSLEGKLLLKTIQTKRLRSTNKPETGKVAPNFETKDINGKMVKLENLKGKYVLLVFWATWCVPCVKEIPQIIDIRKKYTSEKLEVISISLDEDKQKHKTFVKHKKMDWTHIIGTKTIIQDYFINGIPETLLVDPTGKVVYMNVGNDKESLQKAIATYL